MGGPVQLSVVIWTDAQAISTSQYGQCFVEHSLAVAKRAESKFLTSRQQLYGTLNPSCC